MSLSLSTLDFGPQCRIGLLKRNSSPLEFPLGVFEVLIDLGLVVQVKSNRTLDLAAFEQREVLLNGFRRLPVLE